VFFQLVTVVGRVIGRSIIEAYQQTVSRHGLRGATMSEASAGRVATHTTNVHLGMTLDEACKILNVQPNTPKELVEKVSLADGVLMENLKRCFVLEVSTFIQCE
jgi:hypothetical protein